MLLEQIATSQITMYNLICDIFTFNIKWTYFYPSIMINYTIFKFVSAKYVVICHHQLAGILDVCMQAYQKMDGEEHLSM